MSARLLNLPEKSILFISALFIVLFLAALGYLPALGGAFHFDDFGSLAGLASVTDRSSALQFVFSGDTGPTGRPLALASFLLNQAAWPDNPAIFLQTNLVIHLCNGLLLALVCLRLARLRHDLIQYPRLFALTAALLWLLLPINASASLLIVQRMTTLSAFFVLSGLLLYLIGRARSSERPVSGFTLMTLAVVIFTPLATFTKENGALLPLYILIIEFTLLTQLPKPSPRWFRGWQLIFLGLPIILIAAFLTNSLFHATESYINRPFNLLERVTTQAAILFDYIRLVLLPRPLAITPFYDDYPLTPLLIGVLLIGLWGLLIGLAIQLRHKTPILSFAVLWFFAGHLLESTVLPLELYYLHRNYLPSLSLVVLIAAAFYGRYSWVKPYWRFLVLPYLLIVGLVLYETATVWGKPDLAGELWLIEHPTSQRAAAFLSDHYRLTGDHQTADKILREAFIANPENTGAALNYLRSACNERTAKEFNEAFDKTNHVLKDGQFSNRATQMLDSLITLSERNQCPYLQDPLIHQMVESLLANYHYQRSSRQFHNLHLLKFRLHFTSGDFSKALESLMTAYERYPNLDTLKLIAEVLVSAGRQEDALMLVQRAEPPQTRHPLKLSLWKQQRETLEQQVRSFRN